MNFLCQTRISEIDPRHVGSMAVRGHKIKRLWRSLTHEKMIEIFGEKLKQIWDLMDSYGGFIWFYDVNYGDVI